MGLTVDHVLALVDEKVPGAVGIVLGAYELLTVAWDTGLDGLIDVLVGKASSLPLVGEVKDVLSKVTSGDFLDPKQIFRDALKAGADVAQKAIIDALIAKVFEWVLSLATGAGGAVVQGVIGIYKAIVFVIQRAGELADLLNAMLDAVDALLSRDGGAIGRLAKKVEDALELGVGLLLKFLLSYLGLDKLPKEVAVGIVAVRSKVDDLIKKLLDWFVGIGRKLLGLSGSQGETQQLTRPEESEDHNHKVKVWLDATKSGNAVLMIQASAKQDGIAYLKKLCQCGSAQDRDTAKELLQLGEGAVVDGTKAAQGTKKAVAAGKKKPTSVAKVQIGGKGGSNEQVIPKKQSAKAKTKTIAKRLAKLGGCGCGVKGQGSGAQASGQCFALGMSWNENRGKQTGPHPFEVEALGLWALTRKASAVLHAPPEEASRRVLRLRLDKVRRTGWTWACCGV